MVLLAVGLAQRSRETFSLVVLYCSHMIPTSDHPAASPPFPGDDSLCESCGYSLRGLQPDGVCPECGSAISESDPANRTGLPWQNEMSVRSWVKTTWMMVRRPREAYRQIRFDHSLSDSAADFRAIAYLTVMGIIVGLIWGGFIRYGLGDARDRTDGIMLSALSIVVFALPATLVMISLTLIEALGVVWVSKRRGWRVPLRYAFPVGCYAAIAWIPSIIVCGLAFTVVLRALESSSIHPWITGRFSYLYMLVVFMLSILWFETLVWLGVRQVKFANSN